MENIYQQVVQAVENGAKFSVDFRSRSLRLNGRSVIREGNYEGSLGVEPCTVERVPVSNRGAVSSVQAFRALGT